ncbi:hypothetical protein FB446DRAFT_758190 [Lentinula raphanica]|nr:hypothetical protein C8R42DRAFT_665796 [Lentinula raphanica]KAJ3766375.1 hypothetical protein FB446DRAFT_758190 [Lentinula raphanica]
MVFISRLLPSQSRSHSVPTSNVYCLRNLLVVLLWIFGIASLACAGPIPNIGDISVPPPGRTGGTGSMFLSESQHGHAKYRISHGGDVESKVMPDSFDQRVQELLTEFNPSLVVVLDREYVLGKPREPDHDGYVHCEVMGIANPQVFYRVKLKPNHGPLDGVVESGRTGAELFRLPLPGEAVKAEPTGPLVEEQHP